MAQARNAIRGIAHHGAGRDPATILTALNRLGASASLRAGQRLLLYTDGLIERRGETVAHSLERLRQEALSLSTSALADMCIRLQARMLRLQPRHDDDLCILAVERIS
jgi:serine phosphatase RsbU (regulator of sigma subunit)